MMEGVAAILFFVPAANSWNEHHGVGVLADSILDRIITSADTMVINGDVSMRQHHSKQ
jgi:hypothetical protein